MGTIDGHAARSAPQFAVQARFASRSATSMSGAVHGDRQCVVRWEGDGRLLACHCRAGAASSGSSSGAPTTPAPQVTVRVRSLRRGSRFSRATRGSHQLVLPVTSSVRSADDSSCSANNAGGQRDAGSSSVEHYALVVKPSDERREASVEPPGDIAECAEAQVMPRWAGTEPVRRFRAKPGTMLKLDRRRAKHFQYSMTIPVGATIGLTSPGMAAANRTRAVALHQFSSSVRARSVQPNRAQFGCPSATGVWYSVA